MMCTVSLIILKDVSLRIGVFLQCNPVTDYKSFICLSEPVSGTL